MGLPLFRLTIDEEGQTGVTAVALVDDPAIKINWIAFHQNKPFKFETISEGDAEKRIISGPLMLADTPIFRSDKRGEYNVVFDADTIEKIVEKYHKNAFEKNVNPMHNSMMLLPDIFMRSDFIINRARGFNPPKGFEGLPDGSWFGEFKVLDDKTWNEFVKTGVFKGFSVEGYFNEEPAETLTDSEIELIAELVS
jgi:hypothetical protein